MNLEIWNLKMWIEQRSSLDGSPKKDSPSKNMVDKQILIGLEDRIDLLEQSSKKKQDRLNRDTTDLWDQLGEMKQHLKSLSVDVNDLKSRPQQFAS